MKAFDDIERMIIKHIEDIDMDIKYPKSNTLIPELYKAKSLALQALVDLKNAKDGSK